MTFTSDWFSSNIPRWEKHLAHLKGERCTALELGSYEGRSAIWMLDNILTHPHSRLYCVDNGPKTILMDNLQAFREKCSITIGDATQFAIDNRWRALDLVYIDADHIARDVIIQASLLWPSLRPGGVLIFDDYDNTRFTVKPAVDFFLEHWTGHEVLYLKHQAMIKKAVT